MFVVAVRVSPSNSNSKRTSRFCAPPDSFERVFLCATTGSENQYTVFQDVLPPL